MQKEEVATEVVLEYVKQTNKTAPKSPQQIFPLIVSNCVVPIANQ